MMNQDPRKPKSGGRQKRDKGQFGEQNGAIYPQTK
jgi:hypothetical protein